MIRCLDYFLSHISQYLWISSWKRVPHTLIFILGKKDRHHNLQVIVTQIGTMGTILHARLAFLCLKDEGVSLDPTFNVSVIFGKRNEPFLLACARQLIEHIRTLILHLSGKLHEH
ncbi:uncharacterized protein [Typha angustifolia]|uniref:uncharacterized protein n=1 Tax=Typha angustifolia TaxID=59011 RepID=UPI003C2B794E